MPFDKRSYNSWSAMCHRCYNPNRSGYYKYGGRGIAVCDRWLESFQNFLEDMGPRPEGMSLDRVDNEGNYSPDNCRWATPTEQAMNKRPYKCNKLGESNIGLHKGSYSVRFRRNKKMVYDKSFATLQEAVKARDEFLRKED